MRKRWPRPYVILQGSVPEAFVSGEVTRAKHVHFEVRSEPNTVMKGYFMVCCGLVRCQNSTIDDQRVWRIMRKVCESELVTNI